MKGKKAKWILPVIACAVLLAGLAAKLCLDRFVWAAGSLIPRSSAQLDLRGRELSAAEYDRLRGALPDCEILWDVPFQGTRYPSDTQSLQIDRLTEQDVLTLDYFPELTVLDASGCDDYEALLTLAARRPACQVAYQVTLGGQAYANDTTALHIKDPSVQELEQLLPFLPNVAEIEFTGRMPDREALERLQNAFPAIRFRWEVPLGDMVLDSSVTELDLSGRELSSAELQELLRWLPELTYADIRGCQLTDGEMMALAQQYPDCFFLWELTIGDKKFPTDAAELDISGQKLDSTEQIEALLPLFPNLERVIMSFCGFDDETMSALDQKYEDIRFVWSVRIGNVYVRTDAEYFYPFTFDSDMVVDSEDIYPLRYCTDMIAIDIGHMTTVDNCEWAAFMPKLKYLVIVETAITDLTPLSGLKELVFLEIFTTKITDYTPLLGCTALEDLNLGNTFGDPAPIAQMTWLKNLWWSGIAGTYGLPCSNAPELLAEALPNTQMRFRLSNPNVKNGWRQLDNYYKMRDVMGVFYLD